MPGLILNEGAVINCAHLGKAQPVTIFPRVKVMRQSIIRLIDNFNIIGCGLAGSGNPPCATANWLSASLRVKAGGSPVVIQDSQSTCTPTATPLNIIAVQDRVRAI